MDLAKEEIDKLTQANQVFKLYTLSRQQVEYSLDIKLTDKAWQAYVTSENRKLKKTKVRLIRSNICLKSLKRNQNLSSHFQMSRSRRQQKHGNGNCASQLKISELQAFLKVINMITKLKKLRNTNTANLIDQDPSTRFMVMLTYFKRTMSSPS